jgi:hypothetical protein
MGSEIENYSVLEVRSVVGFLPAEGARHSEINRWFVSVYSQKAERKHLCDATHL